ncbi:MAG TPA: MFS transporter [Thiolinea sp.]|nr:MFS transporter [Thiolinea sp.]
MKSNPVDVRALRSIALQFWLNGVLFSSLVPRLPELRDQLGVSIEALGQAMSMAMLGGIFGSLTVDWVCRRFNLKHVMVFGAVLLIAAVGLIAFSPTLGVFALILAAMATLDAYVDVAMNIQGSQLSARARKPVMNRLHGLWSIGTVCGSLGAAAAIALGWSLQQQLLMLALISAGLLAYVVMGLKQPLAEPEPHTETVGRMAQWGRMGIFAVLGAAAITPELISSDWSAFRIRDDLQQSHQLASFGFVVFGTGMMIGRLGGDEVMHRFGQARTLSVACLLAFLGIAVVAFVDQVYGVFAGLVLAGLGVSVFFPTMYDNAARASRRGGAAMLGAMTMGSRLAALGLPVMVGYIAAWQSVGMAFALLALPAIVVLALLNRTQAPATLRVPAG